LSQSTIAVSGWPMALKDATISLSRASAASVSRSRLSGAVTSLSHLDYAEVLQ
jgi:hypothetical protein